MKKLLFIILLLHTFGFSQTTYVPDDNFEQALIDEGYDDALDDSVLTADISGITSLDVSHDSISDLTGIEDFTALMYLNCQHNDLTSLDVSNNTALTVLSCQHNDLTSLNVNTNTALTELSCSNNQLTSLDVSTNIALTFLSCGDGNQLTSLNVSSNTVLTELHCANNQLTSLDVSANTALTDLTCSDNQLTSLDVSANTALTYLSCSSNPLTSLDVSANTELYYLNCGNNQLTSLDVSANTALTDLSCANNQLTSLDVSNNTALIVLICWSNQLTSLDVSNNTALVYMDCSGNQLTTLDVSSNTAFIGLVCSYNQLSYLDMSNGVTDAFEIFIATDNSLTCIETLDSEYATANWTYANGNIDEGVTFAENCSQVSIDAEIIPLKFQLHNAYPNPFNPVTTLRYDLPENSVVNIVVFDMMGREVRTLINQTQNAGHQSVVWDATNDYGKPVSAGIYLYQIQAGEYISTKKMVLLK